MPFFQPLSPDIHSCFSVSSARSHQVSRFMITSHHPEWPKALLLHLPRMHCISPFSFWLRTSGRPSKAPRRIPRSSCRYTHPPETGAYAVSRLLFSFHPPSLRVCRFPSCDLKQVYHRIVKAKRRNIFHLRTEAGGVSGFLSCQRLFCIVN